MGLWPYGHMALWLYGHRATWVWGHRGPRTKPPPVKDIRPKMLQRTQLDAHRNNKNRPSHMLVFDGESFIKDSAYAADLLISFNGSILVRYSQAEVAAHLVSVIVINYDTESVYKSLTSRDLKTPTEKTLLGHGYESYCNWA